MVNDYDPNDSEEGNRERAERGRVYTRCDTCHKFYQWFSGKTCPGCGKGKMI